MKQTEQKILEDIEQFDCQVVSVVDPDQIKPTFTYSIGLARSLGVPEVIVMAARPELGQALVNTYKDRVRRGELFLPDIPYLGFLGKFPVYFRSVTERHREAYMPSATWLYKGLDYAALQIVFPTVDGVWPWDSAASDWFRSNQLLLDVDDEGSAPAV